jgi:hypothetical protein
MHLVAVADPLSHQWRWQIVDTEGKEIAASPARYGTVAEALEAGRERFLRVV